jgi:xylan 1,4-beta-xylosidase
VEPDSDDYSFTARPGFLRLRGGQSPVSCFRQTLMARRQEDFSFKAETYMEFEPKSFQEFAGLTWRYDEENQYLLTVGFDEKLGRVLHVRTVVNSKYESSRYEIAPATGGLYLGLTVNERWGAFRWSLDGTHWKTLRPMLDAANLGDGAPGNGFTGAFVGIYCCDLANYRAAADFKYFKYEAL